MTVETTTTPATAPVTNLRQTRKEMAAAKQAHPAGKAAPAKATKAAPAKKAPAAKATTEKPSVAKKMWTATGRSGQAVHRMFAGEIVAALDVADPKSEKVLPRGGQIWNFYTDAAKAQAAADRLNGKGYDAVVTTDVKIVK
jgi:hypothetical protein